jgi:hypothetical protein
MGKNDMPEVAHNSVPYDSKTMETIEKSNI